MQFTDAAIIFATLLGPILAVQAQRWVDRQRQRQERRITIFRTLMATRAASLSSDHVQALNAIPIEFYGRRKAHREVVQAWRDLLDHLNQEQMDLALWGQKRQEFFIELLWKLATALGYRFTKLELQREVYSPRGHARLENEQEVIRQGLFRIFSGEAAFPLDIRSMPVDEVALEQQRKLQLLIQQWFAGASSVNVTMHGPGKEGNNKAHL